MTKKNAIIDFALSDINDDNWKVIADMLDALAWKTFKMAIGDGEPAVGFREIMPVICSKDELKDYVKKIHK